MSHKMLSCWEAAAAAPGDHAESREAVQRGGARWCHVHADRSFVERTWLHAFMHGMLSKHCSVIRPLKADCTFVQPPSPPPPPPPSFFNLGWFCSVASRTLITGWTRESIGSIRCHSEVGLGSVLYHGAKQKVKMLWRNATGAVRGVGATRAVD